MNKSREIKTLLLKFEKENKDLKNKISELSSELNTKKAFIEYLNTELKKHKKEEDSRLLVSISSTAEPTPVEIIQKSLQPWLETKHIITNIGMFNDLKTERE